MEKNNYNKIIGRLKQIKPVNESATKLTDRIIQKIETVPDKKKFRIRIKVNSKQWHAIYGFRIVTTAAAVFLTGFFIYQQWQFNYKTSQTDTRITEIKQPVVESTDTQTRQEMMQRIYEETGNSINGIHLGLYSGDPIPLDRNTLVYILKLSNEIKKKNRNNRQKLQQYISNPSESIIQKIFYNENTD